MSQKRLAFFWASYHVTYIIAVVVSLNLTFSEHGAHLSKLLR